MGMEEESMRVVTVVIVQLVISAFLTASVMPAVLLLAPAVQDEPGLGFGIAVGIGATCFAAVALAWRSWRRT